MGAAVPKSGGIAYSASLRFVIIDELDQIAAIVILLQMSVDATDISFG
jgi:hypothetical protein